jgi:hypothetical protein
MPEESAGFLRSLYLPMVGTASQHKILDERDEGIVIFVHGSVHELEMFSYKQLYSHIRTLLGHWRGGWSERWSNGGRRCPVPEVALL